LDEKIGHYQQLSRLVSDRTVLEGIESLIEKYEVEKRALHPDEP
jgi:hypothetical protein